MWLFDCDGTLYLDSPEVHEDFKTLLANYFAAKLNTTPDEVLAMREELLAKHKTEFTLLAFKEEFSIDISEAIEASYLQLDLAKYGLVEQDPALQHLFSQLRGTKIVFTNAPCVWAERIITYLGIKQHFDSVLGIDNLDFLSKTDDRVYEKVNNLFPAEHVIFCDDNHTNISRGIAHGWHGVHFSRTGKTEPGEHETIFSLSDLLSTHAFLNQEGSV